MAARLDNNSQAIDFLRMNKITDYVVRTSGEKDNTVIFRSDKENTVEENLENFRKIADMTVGSYFIVEQGARGAHRIEVKNDKVGVSANIGAIPQVAGITEDEVERRISAAIGALQTKQMIERLQQENKDLKQDIKDMQTPINRMITKFEPYIGTIIPALIHKLIPSAPSIQLAGIERENDLDNNNSQTETMENEQTTTTNQEERLANALEKWNAADADFISLIETIAEMAATGDPMYTMAKKMLHK